MSSKVTRFWFPALLAAAAGTATVAAVPWSTGSAHKPRVVVEAERAQISSFVHMPSSPLPTDGKPHEFTVTYQNTSKTDQTVSPQMLVESSDHGPYLHPTDIKLERRTDPGPDNGHSQWQTVRTPTQTGTLYTDLPSAERVLHPGDTLTQTYRLLANRDAQGTVDPLVALYS